MFHLNGCHSVYQGPTKNNQQKVSLFRLPDHLASLCGTSARTARAAQEFGDTAATEAQAGAISWHLGPVALFGCFVHGCCWETLYIFACCGLGGNPHLTAFFVFLLPFQRQPSVGLIVWFLGPVLFFSFGGLGALGVVSPILRDARLRQIEAERPELGKNWRLPHLPQNWLPFFFVLLLLGFPLFSTTGQKRSNFCWGPIFPAKIWTTKIGERGRKESRLGHYVSLPLADSPCWLMQGQ